MNILERGQSCAEIGIKAEEKAQILQMKTKKARCRFCRPCATPCANEEMH